MCINLRLEIQLESAQGPKQETAVYGHVMVVVSRSYPFIPTVLVDVFMFFVTRTSS